MNSIPVLYYVGDASRNMEEFMKFWREQVHGWRDVEQLCLHCNLDRDRWEFVQTRFSLPMSVLKKKRDEINWSHVSSEYEKFIDKDVIELKDYVDFNAVVMWSRNVTEKCIRKLADRIDFHVLSQDRDMSFEFMEDFRDQMDWKEVLERRIRKRRIDDEFLVKFSGCVDWEILSRYWNFSDEQLDKYKDLLDWRTLSVWHKWNVNTVARYMELIDWEIISKCGNWFHTPSKMENMRKEALFHVS